MTNPTTEPESTDTIALPALATAPETPEATKPTPGVATRFRAGHDPRRNLNGRPKKPKPVPAPPQKSVKELAREKTTEAIELLASIMSDTKASRKDRMTAAMALLDRGHGKPVAHVETNSDSKFEQMSDAEFLSYLTNTVGRLDLHSEIIGVIEHDE
jgi:hypothetical protein